MAVKIQVKKGAQAGEPVEPLRIFKFGGYNDVPSVDECNKDRFGGKGANLMKMAHLGVPVPSGFTFPCSCSIKYLGLMSNASKLAFRHQLRGALSDGVAYLRDQFGHIPLMSVRSGARVSMPGMMDTILNVGLTSESLPFWIERLGERAALDSYRRLIQMFSSVALGVPLELFEEVLAGEKALAGVESDSELDATSLTRVIARYKATVVSAGHQFPDTVEDQLYQATLAVFKSWNNDRAKEYRKIHGYSDAWGTAVNVQAMVFGNLNDNSATGVLFTRDPATGIDHVVGEYLVNAQGEDVVAGIRTPEQLGLMATWNPGAYNELMHWCAFLEDHFRDMQDIEFTIQDGELFILQTRNGKRSAKAAFVVAADLLDQGAITTAEALSRVTTEQLLVLMKDQIDPSFTTPAHVVGIPAGGGLVTGVAVFSSEAAINCTSPCILIRKETDPDDIAGMNASVGIFTSTGGLTSHAAVVARGMNKTCVVGATSMQVKKNVACLDGGVSIHEGTMVTLDGATGRVWVGIDVPVVKGALIPEASALLGHALAGRPLRLDVGVGSSSQAIEALVSGLTGPAHVDLCALWGVRSHDITSKDSEDFSSVLETLVLSAIKHSKCLVIHARPIGDYLPPVDQSFDCMFGDQGYLADGISVCWLAKVVDKHKQALKGSSVSFDIASVPSTNDKSSWQYWWCEGRARISSAGVRILGAMATLQDLLATDTPMIVDDQTLKTVFGSKEAMDTVVSLIEQFRGVKVVGTNAGQEPVYWFNAFGG